MNENINYKKLFDDAQEKNLWGFGNDVLYNMCKDHPNHNDKSEIIGKMWLIGRSYAVALERNSMGTKGDNFYEKDLVDNISKNKKTIDDIIKEHKDNKDNKDLDDVVRDHKKIMTIINRFTGKDNRSFVSKYLHFHCPDSFYIYDERAKKAINNLIGKIENIKDSEEYDKDYKKFCKKIESLKKELIKAGINKEDLTPRKIDNFLLYYCKKNGI